MSKSQKYMELMEELKKLANEPVVLIDESVVDGEAVQMMRELRQFIERFRRLKDWEDTVPLPLKQEDIQKLGRDELAYIVGLFWREWYNGDECPRDKCSSYFCKHCQKRKEEADQELADGELDPEDYNIMAKDGFFDGDCDNDTQDGCWPNYYLWCYRNGIDPRTGKKEAKC